MGEGSDDMFCADVGSIVSSSDILKHQRALKQGELRLCVIQHQEV